MVTGCSEQQLLKRSGTHSPWVTVRARKGVTEARNSNETKATPVLIWKHDLEGTLLPIFYHFSHFSPFWGVSGEENGLFHYLCYFEHSNRWNINQCDRLHLTSTATNYGNVEEGSTGPGVSQLLCVRPWASPSMACSLVHSPVKCRHKLNQGFPKRSTQVIWEVYGWIIVNIRAYW